jgi:hypothetical protein
VEEGEKGTPFLETCSTETLGIQLLIVKKLQELGLWFLVEQGGKEAPFRWDGSPENLGTQPLMET